MDEEEVVRAEECGKNSVFEQRSTYFRVELFSRSNGFFMLRSLTRTLHHTRLFSLIVAGQHLILRRWEQGMGLLCDLVKLVST